MTQRPDTSNPKSAGADFSDMLQDALTTANACFMAGVQAGSDCLNKPLRSREAAALDIAKTALRIIAKPVNGESELEWAMRMAATKALADIDTIMGKDTSNG